jgi:hypothetical protein
MLEIGTKVHDVFQRRVRGTIVGTCEYENTKGYIVELDPRMRASTHTGIYIRLIVMEVTSTVKDDDN